LGISIKNELKDSEEKCGGYQYLVVNLLWTEDWVSDGLMGGNLWYFGKDTESALAAAEKGVDAILPIPDVITTFPGGIAGSGK